MAWSLTRTHSVFGNQRVVMIDVTPDSAEANIETGLDVVTAFSMGIKSLTALAKLDENVDSSGTAANGTIGASGFTSGDEFFLVCYGR